MIIIGAKGHAREVLGVLLASGYSKPVCLYDDINPDNGQDVWGAFKIIRNPLDAQRVLADDKEFVIAIGKPEHRKVMAEKFMAWGGEMVSVISPDARIGKHNKLGRGLNVMTGAVITEDVKIDTGVLIHVHCSIHHDVEVGVYSELSPGCRVLGGARIGKGVSIGAGAIILPGILIEDGATVAAGAVVTRNVTAGSVVMGIPARQK